MQKKQDFTHRRPHRRSITASNSPQGLRRSYANGVSMLLLRHTAFHCLSPLVATPLLLHPRIALWVPQTPPLLKKGTNAHEDTHVEQRRVTLSLVSLISWTPHLMKAGHERNLDVRFMETWPGGALLVSPPSVEIAYIMLGTSRAPLDLNLVAVFQHCHAFCPIVFIALAPLVIHSNSLSICLEVRFRPRCKCALKEIAQVRLDNGRSRGHVDSSNGYENEFLCLTYQLPEEL